jgi:hypothetical protein
LRSSGFWFSTCARAEVNSAYSATACGLEEADLAAVLERHAYAEVLLYRRAYRVAGD